MGLMGRGVRFVLASVPAALLVAPAGASAGAGSGYAPIFEPGKFSQPKVRTDGLLTVGAQETLRVSHVAPRPHLKLKPFITAPISASICNVEPPSFEFFSPCLPQPLYPVPGTRRLKANKKGRASLTFVMPAAYEYIDFNDPTQSHPIYLIDKQTVGVEIDVSWKPQPRTLVTTFVHGSAVVQVPPPPPAP